MKVNELREMTAVELTKKLELAKDELFKLRFQLATSQLENMMRIREVRRNIARLKTILRENELIVLNSTTTRGSMPKARGES